VKEEDLMKAILRELQALNEREDRSRDTLESMCFELAVAHVGSALNTMRVLKTLMAAGGVGRHLRAVIDVHLRKTTVSDAVLMMDLERMPAREPEAEPFPATLGGFIDQVAEGLKVRAAAARAAAEAPREVRLTPDEAAAGCVLPIRLDGKSVELMLPAGVRDGDTFAAQGDDGRTLQIKIAVAASWPNAARMHVNGSQRRNSKEVV
jgi:hypothetical protein